MSGQPTMGAFELLRQAAQVLEREARNLPLGLAPAGSPASPFDKDRLRQQAHQLIETLLITFSEATGERGLPAEDKIPLLQCDQSAQAGGEGRARFIVANEESTESSVTLYCTDFISDSGHQIPSARVSVLPRVHIIAPRADAVFEIRLAVPLQAPSGTYSGLIQAMGSKYVKAVLSLEVI